MLCVSNHQPRAAECFGCVKDPWRNGEGHKAGGSGGFPRLCPSTKQTVQIFLLWLSSRTLSACRQNGVQGMGCDTVLSRKVHSQVTDRRTDRGTHVGAGSGRCKVRRFDDGCGMSGLWEKAVVCQGDCEQGYRVAEYSRDFPDHAPRRTSDGHHVASDLTSHFLKRVYLSSEVMR